MTVKGIVTSRLWPGFEDPVCQSQRNFRDIMKALSEPGSIVSMDKLKTEGRVSPALFAVALTLVDQDLSVWLSPALRSDSLEDNLRFHCGCQIVGSAAEADFAFITLSELDDLSIFKRGSEEYPDRFATLVIEAEGLYDSGDWVFSGPGIKGARTVGIEGFTESHERLLKANQQNFPMGYDFLIAQQTQLMGVPRTTLVQRQPEARAFVKGNQEGDLSCM